MLRVNVDLFLVSFEKFTFEFSSFEFSTIDLRDIIIINEIIDKNERFSIIKTLLSSYLYYSEINNILFFLMSRIISYLFIYNFSRIKS